MISARRTCTRTTNICSRSADSGRLGATATLEHLQWQAHGHAGSDRQKFSPKIHRSRPELRHRKRQPVQRFIIGSATCRNNFEIRGDTQRTQTTQSAGIQPLAIQNLPATSFPPPRSSQTAGQLQASRCGSIASAAAFCRRRTETPGDLRSGNGGSIELR